MPVLQTNMNIKHLMASAVIALSTAISSPAASDNSPVKVELQHQDNQWSLLRDGKPYFIKGAGGDGSKTLLAEDGGNSFRTWGADDIQDKLDEANKLGLSVTVGIWLKHEGQDGFNYSKPKDVADQFEKAKAAIEKYKDNPAVLIWAIGNEMEGYKAGDNPAIWKAVEDIAALVKKLDPNHPTMTVIAEIGGKRVQSINSLCPDIDIVGINTYAAVGSIGERYKKIGGTKPYVVTEFGPPGTWEIGKTDYGAPSEPTSTRKGEIYKTGYEKGILAEKDLCLGSYVFTWGHKREATSTWYGLFLSDETQLEPIHTMAELWSGKAPANRCPQIEPIHLDGGDHVKPGETIHATVKLSDPDGDPLTTKWELAAELKKAPPGGIGLAAPPSFPNAIVHSSNEDAEIKLPTEPGTYRLYVYAYDGHGNAATANVPLHIAPDKSDTTPEK